VFDFDPELEDLPAEEREAILAAEAAEEEGLEVEDLDLPVASGGDEEPEA